MLSRHFVSGLFVAAFAAVVMSGCATVKKAETAYFEPSGDANIISIPASGPKNVAVVSYGPHASMNVQATVLQGVASVHMVLVLRKESGPLTFTGRRVIFEVGGTRDEREVTWDEALIESNRPRTERLPFTAELQPPGIALTTTEGVVHLGRYQSVLVVPLGFQAANEFRLILPAVTGGKPVTLNFVRRSGK